MAMTVQLHPVARGDDLGDQRRPALHLLAGEKERGRGAALAQSLEHRGGPLWVRAIIEGEDNALVPVPPHLYSQGGAEPRHDRRKRRTGVQHGGSASAGAEQRFGQLACCAAL
jgi:hypothetical protein